MQNHDSRCRARQASHYSPWRVSQFLLHVLVHVARFIIFGESSFLNLQTLSEAVMTILFFLALSSPHFTHESILLFSFLMVKRGFQVSSITEEIVADC
jgi:hypothetical protein